MNGVRVSTVNCAACSVVKGACQNTQANVSLSSICNRRSVQLIFCRLWKHLLISKPLEYKLDLPWVMSFLLGLHLPRLVAWEGRTTVADGCELFVSLSFCVCKGKVTNIILYYFFNCFIINIFY